MTTRKTPRRRREGETVMDDIDRAIVDRLALDGRLPYSKLGVEVGLSEAATRQRVQRLIDKGYMQIVAVTDPLVTRGSVMALVGLRVQGDSREVAKKISELHESIYVVATSGSFDVIAEIVGKTHEDLLAVLNDHVRQIPGVISTETFVYLDLFKHTFVYET
ncbi:MAG TPA: Lrp/AsnC family transcriptional regulator [Baekduia sp.]|uniref:Lrp/AsnC family transcriptional regulator n=1 Tax=Baekduia sp. TaxID=2600305 RepID=UPI002C28592A|nr:Lrp/AsnC family transcriptional regulator [Baekduia sp.]HMJ35147.1 Lrp/AsnC family transcriptional regulator [Baekduia sp.]